MTKRNPVSGIKNIWFDSQQVDNTDLTLEQNFNDTIESSTISNHIGTGILPEVLVQNILFDSDLASGFLDGTVVETQNQPADNNFGNQLEITLSNSVARGRKAVKIGIIGLDFESNLQYETFYFRNNETQIGRKHFAKILTILFNDFLGNPDLSFNLGGRIVIKEAKPLSLSRLPVMVAQDVQPNLFFRDLFLDGFLSLTSFLQSALPLYNIDSLNIYTSELDNKILLSNDVTSQIGEKFLATTNNIQKISLLLSVRNLVVGSEDDLAWNGDLVVSIYPLQSDVTCSTDIAPNLPIDFPPYNIPVAQISINYNTLRDTGVILDSVPQPVDFVFSNSPIAAGNVLIPGAYYALAIKRSGSANKCDILISVGSNLIPESRITTFTGSLWVDLPEEQLWFKVWNDAAKISDGQAYESGHGIIIPKTILDEASQSTIDYSKEGIQFVGNDIYRAVVAATTEETVPVPDQRTGNPILSRQQFVPKISLLNTIDIINLEKASEPLVIGAIVDKNTKFFDSVQSIIKSKLYSASLVGDELLIKIITDQTDTSRYDTDITDLQSHLVLGDFEGAKIIPNADEPSIYYRIANARLCSMVLGDVNGDGVVTIEDLNLLNEFLNYDLTLGPPVNTEYSILDGYTTITNGYTSMRGSFTDQFSIHFQLIRSSDGYVIAEGTDGILVANPADITSAQFTSASVLFSPIFGLDGYKLMIDTPTVLDGYGKFDIVNVDLLTDVITIRKIILNDETISQMFRADIDGDFHITTNDGYLLQQYIDRYPLSASPTSVYPAPMTNAYTNIGKTFNVVKFKLEKFIDRTDDYASNPSTRALEGSTAEIHPVPDAFMADGYFKSHDFLNNPSIIVIEKKLTWEESLILVNSRAKLVPSVFTSLTGFSPTLCGVDGIECSVYGSKPNFDPGRVDYFAPNNIILGEAGELKRPDGEFYKVDFEVGTIVLEIPDGLFGSERTINILDDFISDYTGTGITRLGFPAMKFADCTYVTSSALANDQLRLSVSVQSFSPNTTGISDDLLEGAIVDGKMGVSIDYSTGLLTLNFTNLYQDAVLETLSTKVQINVFLKKGGFNNQPLFVDSVKVQNMLSLISVFSGANVGGPSALVDLETDVTGVLPIIHGGTGLSSVGAYGTVMVSNGSGISYQFAPFLLGVIPFSLGIPDADRIPRTDGYGLLDPSFYYKNPIFISSLSGVASHDGYVPATIGAFTFKFDSFILEGLSTIKLEAILETTNVSNVAEILLFNKTTNAYISLTGMTTSLATATVIRSQDIKSLLSLGTTGLGNIDFIYEIHLRLNPSSAIETAICKMARLVMTYNNPYYAVPPLAHSSNFVPYLPSPTPS